jgi:hypothetical protein
MRWLRGSVDPLTSALLLAGLAACLAIASAESWRAAALAVAASAAVIATRVRFCAYGGIGLLLVVALIVLTGPG